MTKFNDLQTKKSALQETFRCIEANAWAAQKRYCSTAGDTPGGQVARNLDEQEFERLNVDGERVQKELQSVQEEIDAIFLSPISSAACESSTALLSLGTLHALLTRMLERGVPSGIPVYLEGCDCVGACKGASLDDRRYDTYEGGVLLLTRD
jgi:hypothetical protein